MRMSIITTLCIHYYCYIIYILIMVIYICNAFIYDIYIIGISSSGLSVHEANLESNDTTFRGFPWVLRLRHIMTYAKNIPEAIELWKDTNNTVGFNHGIGK